MADNDAKTEILQPVTLQEARDQVGDDLPSEANDRLLTRLIKMADAYLVGAIGENYPRDDERARQLALFVIDEWYNAGGKSQKVSATIEKLVHDFTLQLQMEQRRAAENGAQETDSNSTP